MALAKRHRAGTPVTLGAASLTTALGTGATAYGAIGSALESYAHGNQYALAKFDGLYFTANTTKMALESFPPTREWAEVLSGMLEQGLDLVDTADKTKCGE